ncbi:MAG: uroporphyrinogen-III synthase [Bacteroidota bacterium]
MKLTKTKKQIKKVAKSISKAASRVKKSFTKKGSKAVEPKKVGAAAATVTPARPIKTILITQAKPENDKNPYNELSRKYKVEFEFKPFIHLVGIENREFRRYKIHPLTFQSVVFTSRNIIDHYFKLCEELRIRMPDETKYYCMTEAIALYLQKYILYRKRKVFYGDGSLQNFFKVVLHHKNDGERFLVPCADIHKSDIPDFLKKSNIEFAEAVILKTLPIELKKKDLNYDALIFFGPTGVNALLHNFPDYKQRNQVIGGFGPLTQQALENAKLNCDIKAPSVETPSMVMAIDNYIVASKKK